MNKLSSKQKVLRIVIAVFILLGGVGAILWYQKTQLVAPLAQAAATSAFPIYAATTLPQGFTLDASSISQTSEALLVVAKNSGGKIISITETPIPKEFDYETFYKDRFVGIQDAQSIYGRGKVGILDDAVSGSLVTDSTWIIVKGYKDMPAKDMKQLIEGLKPVQ